MFQKRKTAQKKHEPKKLVILLILDGWGIAPAHFGNAISLARTPIMDELERIYPYTTLIAHGKRVGLPPGQPGNSEAGHLNIGAGRVVEQEAVIINKAIADGTFFYNPAFLAAIKHTKEYNSALHVMGLFTGEDSPHAFPGHLLAFISLLKARKVEKVFFHLFTDGRDSSPFAAMGLFKKYKRAFLSVGSVSSIMGRYFAMDRNKQWDRTRRAYELMVLGKGLKFDDVTLAIQHAYNSGNTDEFIEPTLIGKNKKPIGLIKDNDSVVFLNLRSERARQITKPFVLDNFEDRKESFKRAKILKNIFFVALTDFGPDLGQIISAYPSPVLKGTLPFALGLEYPQFYVSESEKYAHVTYFINGGHKKPVVNEERERILSVKVKNFKQIPQMSLDELTKCIQQKIKSKRFSFICANIPNGDMVGHTGDIGAAVKAVEAVDQAVKKIKSTTQRNGGILLITADHGNVEQMIDLKTREICTRHSTNPVPFIIVGDAYKGARLRKNGSLCDIAPTILDIFGIAVPKEMTGKTLLSH